MKKKQAARSLQGFLGLGVSIAGSVSMYEAQINIPKVLSGAAPGSTQTGG